MGIFEVWETKSEKPSLGYTFFYNKHLSQKKSPKDPNTQQKFRVKLKARIIHTDAHSSEKVTVDEQKAVKFKAHRGNKHGKS